MLDIAQVRGRARDGLGERCMRLRPESLMRHHEHMFALTTASTASEQEQNTSVPPRGTRAPGADVRIVRRGARSYARRVGWLAGSWLRSRGPVFERVPDTYPTACQAPCRRLDGAPVGR